MATNKVVFGTETLIDLTKDTVSASTLVKGYTAHSASGQAITGTADYYPKTGGTISGDVAVTGGFVAKSAARFEGDVQFGTGTSKCVINATNGNITAPNIVYSVNGSAGAVTLSIPVVTDTYSATSTNGMSGKAVASAVSSKISASGSRGSIAGYETTGSATSISATSSDSNETSSNVTVSNGTSGTSWTKIVRLTSASSTVTLGSNWVWANGEAPTIAAGGVLVLCWCGSGGIANFISPSS